MCVYGSLGDYFPYFDKVTDQDSNASNNQEVCVLCFMKFVVYEEKCYKFVYLFCPNTVIKFCESYHSNNVIPHRDYYYHYYYFDQRKPVRVVFIILQNRRYYRYIHALPLVGCS